MNSKLTKYLSDFVDCLQDYFARESISLNEFSKRAKIASGAISAWMNLKYFPSSDSAIKVADFFNCSLDYLFGLSSHHDFVKATKNETFLDRFESLCKQKNLSHYQVAKQCKVGEAMISKWKKGKYPKCETLIVLAKFFDCSIDYLIGRSDAY